LVALLVLAGLVAGGCASSNTQTTGDASASVTSATTTTSSTTSTTRPKPKPKPPKKLPLAGKVVGIDPGHNGRNYTDPSYLNHLIWNGREEEGCDTTGTQTDSGYTEAQFNWNVARYLTTDLKAEGAKVVLTRHSNDGIGPCVNTRADIINRAHANVAIDIHADGGPADGRGVAVLLPVADGPNDHVIAASKRFGHILLARYRALTHMPDSTYDGVDGFEPRDDLAGLNLTRVPKVLIECGNMRNATDAALLVKSSYQRLTAKSFAEAITEYLIGRR
jgi:N-acetylmuramoyl-L-alanine amidase